MPPPSFKSGKKVDDMRKIPSFPTPPSSNTENENANSKIISKHPSSYKSGKKFGSSQNLKNEGMLYSHQSSNIDF